MDFLENLKSAFLNIHIYRPKAAGSNFTVRSERGLTVPNLKCYLLSPSQWCLSLLVSWFLSRLPRSKSGISWTPACMQISQLNQVTSGPPGADSASATQSLGFFQRTSCGSLVLITTVCVLEARTPPRITLGEIIALRFYDISAGLW